MKYQSYKGTEDKFYESAGKWQWLEGVIARLAADFGFSEIRTPTFEYTELFERGVGDTTDIVQKEMYTFKDRGGRSLTLKPELTAGVVRAYVQHGLQQLPLPAKFYYMQPCFRAEKPQSGRFVEHHQFGVELFGAASYLADAEVISVCRELLRRLGLEDKVRLFINSIGCPECRAVYNAALKEFLSGKYDALCDTCKSRYDKNPLRILDCKSEICQEIISGAPKTVDYLCDGCREHFDGLKKALGSLGIDYEVNPKIVRGLDYYTRTVFEFVPKDKLEASQGTVCAGGRYDRLIESIGGDPTPAVGFGMGMERLLLLAADNNVLPEYKAAADIFIGAMGEDGRMKSAALALELRKLGVSAVYDPMERSVKAQMKYADKLNARYSIVIGDTELASGRAVIKSMTEKTQTEGELTAEEIYRAIM